MPNPKSPKSKNHGIAAAQAALGCICAGVVLRLIAQKTELEPIAEAANSILFVPCTFAAIWIAWDLSTPPKKRSLKPILILAILSVCCLARFFIASYPSLIHSQSIPGYCSPQRFWLSMQVLHWLGFLIVAITTGKAVQWVCGIGIRLIDAQNRMPKTLSLARMALLVTLCAAVALTYQRWFLCFSLTILRTETSPTWFEFFPVGARPWAAGLVGGLLLPVHWLAITAILELTRPPKVTDSNRLLELPFRISLIAIWCMLAAALNFASSKLYFSNLLVNGLDHSIASSRWLEYSIGSPYIIPAFYALSDPPMSFYLFKATLQICLVLVCTHWLGRLGYRVGFKSDKPNSAD